MKHRTIQTVVTAILILAVVGCNAGGNKSAGGKVKSFVGHIIGLQVQDLGWVNL